MSEPTIAPVQSAVSEAATVAEVGSVKIERGIPIPPSGGGRPGGSKHDPVLAVIKPGDSVFFSGETMDRDVMSFLTIAKKRGLSMTTRKTVEDGVSGVRIWRREASK